MSPDDARVRVDGETTEGTGAERELRLDPGQHRLRVEADGYEPQTVRLSVLASSDVETRITLAPRAEPSVPAPATVPSPRAPSSGLSPGSIEAPRSDEGAKPALVWGLTAGAAVVVAAVVVASVLAAGGGDDGYAGSSGVVLSF